MHRYLLNLTLLLILLTTACKSTNDRVVPPLPDTTAAAQHIMKDTDAAVTTLPPADTLNTSPAQTNPQSIEDQTAEIMTLLKEKKYAELADFIHPDKGLLFSPYAFIQEKTAVKLTREQLKKADRKKIYRWGEYDGSGEPMNLTLDQYFDKFVYDSDFINKGTQTVNKIQKQGNTINNMNKEYPGSEFAEYHIAGRNPEYRGMDWATLRLIFQNKGNKRYLVAIVHDSWTI